MTDSLAGSFWQAPTRFFLTFAGGAVLASLADTLMPEAFEKERPWNDFAAVAGI